MFGNSYRGRMQQERKLVREPSRGGFLGRSFSVKNLSHVGFVVVFSDFGTDAHNYFGDASKTYR